MTIDEIVKLIEAVSKNGLTSFEYEKDEEVLVLKKKDQVKTSVAPVVISQPAAPIMGQMAMPMAAQAVPAPVEAASAAAGLAVSGSAVEAPAATLATGNVVESPLVGTFYNSASPESDPFVKVGDTVKKGQVLGIVEAMKLMNEIESEFDGVVEAILVNNEDVVEYGQPLFRIS